MIILPYSIHLYLTSTVRVYAIPYGPFSFKTMILVGITNTRPFLLKPQ